MTISNKLVYLSETKKQLRELIESAGLPIESPNNFGIYAAAIKTALSISTLISFLDGIPNDVAFSRASTKMHEQPDGSFVEIPAEVPEYKGMRYGRNVLNISDLSLWTVLTSGNSVSPVVTPNQPDPDGGNNAFRVQLALTGTSSSDYSWIYSVCDLLVSERLCRSVWVKSNTAGAQTVGLNISHAELNITVGTAWSRCYNNQPSGYTAGTTWFGFSTRGGFGTSSVVDITVYQPQAEINKGSVSFIPSEYIDPAFNEYGVAGVNYFPTENGNTVDVNDVVTEAVGASLPEPFKLRLEDGTTNLVGFSAEDHTAYSLEQSTHGVTIPSPLGDWPKLIGNTLNSSHRYNVFGVNHGLLADGELFISFYAKSAEHSKIGVWGWANLNPDTTSFVFDIDTESVIVAKAPYTVDFGPTDSFGFKKIIVSTTVKNSSASNIAIQPQPDSTNGQSYIGDDVSGMYICGIQVETNAATSFTPSTRIADGLSVDLSSYTEEQITSAKIKYYDGSDNLVVEDLFGPEIIVNGDFSNGLSGWTVNENGQTVEVSAGSLHVISSGALCGVSQAAVFTAGDQYLVSAEVNVSSGVGLKFSTPAELLMESTGSYLFTHAATVDSALFVYRRGSAGTDSTIDNVSVRLVNSACTFDSITKILTFNTLISLDIKPVVIL